MKLNKFVHVEIPRPSTFFARMAGNMPMIPSGMYSGEESVPDNLRPTEQLQYSQRSVLNQMREDAAEARNRAQRQEEEK